MDDSKPGEEGAPEKIDLDALRRRINEVLNVVAKFEDWLPGAPQHLPSLYMSRR
jgi:hypothetical protein